MVRNSMYYYFFGAYVGYYVNHPLYTPVANEQLVHIATGFFAVSTLSAELIFIRTITSSNLVA